jgi:hypothetical protein
LTDDDVATLKHLAQQGMGTTPLRARHRPRISRGPACHLRPCPGRRLKRGIDRIPFCISRLVSQVEPTGT